MLRISDTRAEVGAVAATLLSLSVSGQSLTETTPVGQMPPQSAGAVLAPWPNRVRGGQWMLEGQRQQLDLTDPTIGGAIHGLLLNASYQLVQRTESTVLLAAFIPPQHGWPFPLYTWVRYEAKVDGLRVTHTVKNPGRTSAPWAVGAHPYLRAGTAPVAELSLTVSAGVRAVSDVVRVPVNVVPVPGTDSDLSHGRIVEGLPRSELYGDLRRGPRGELARLEAPDGTRTTLWGDEAFRWLQLYAPRDHQREKSLGLGDSGLAIAVEPMTSPTNALATGKDLIRIGAGQSWSASWGIRYGRGNGE